MCSKTLYLFLVTSLFSAIQTCVMSSNSGKFLYFAFGSNLLAERIHIKNPSAAFKSTGKVEGYKLDFGRYSKRWKGDVATITKDVNSEVYGVIWELDVEHQKTLDQQESVPDVYRRIKVEVCNLCFMLF